MGWKLLHHPLYGNYRPYQQPYRSLLLQYTPSPSAASVDGIRRVSPDPLSLHLLEQALAIYADARVISPEEAPASLRDACSLLDCELMRLPLEQAGVLTRNLEQSA